MSGSGKKGGKKKRKISQLTIQQNSQASLPHLGGEYILKKQNRSFLLPSISRPEGGAGPFQGVQDLPRAWGALCLDQWEGFPVSWCKMWAGIPLQEESSSDQLDCPLQKQAQNGTVRRIDPAVHSNSRRLKRVHLLLMWWPRGNQNLNFGSLNEKKLAGPPRKQKRLSEHLKGQQWLLQRLPRRQHLSRRLGSLWRFLLPELVETLSWADWSFK